MPARPKINKLPKEVKDELNKKLRESNYGEYIEIALWLRTLGHDASKSSVARYGKMLKAKDLAIDGLADALGLDTDEAYSDRSAFQILVELGSLRVKEMELISQLKEMGYSGTTQI
tara:strand:- start:892 stop:1239 length:348 start_codon:yes stop_codon:yes gene_type:complete